MKIDVELVGFLELYIYIYIYVATSETSYLILLYFSFDDKLNYIPISK